MPKFVEITAEVIAADEKFAEYLRQAGIEPARKGGSFVGNYDVAPDEFRKYGIVLPKGGMIIPDAEPEELRAALAMGIAARKNRLVAELQEKLGAMENQLHRYRTRDRDQFRRWSKVTGKSVRPPRRVVTEGHMLGFSHEEPELEWFWLDDRLPEATFRAAWFQSARNQVAAEVRRLRKREPHKWTLVPIVHGLVNKLNSLMEGRFSLMRFFLKEGEGVGASHDPFEILPAVRGETYYVDSHPLRLEDFFELQFRGKVYIWTPESADELAKAVEAAVPEYRKAVEALAQRIKGQCLTIRIKTSYDPYENGPAVWFPMDSDFSVEIPGLEETTPLAHLVVAARLEKEFSVQAEYYDYLHKTRFWLSPDKAKAAVLSPQWMKKLVALVRETEN